MSPRPSEEKPAALPAEAGTLILGAGLTGLAAAWKVAQAGGAPLLLERDPRPGGLLKTDRRPGAVIDELPHVLFTKSREVSDLFVRMVGRVRRHSHRLGVLWRDGYIDFPFQNNLHQLGLEDRRLALRGLLDRPCSGAEPRNLEDLALRSLGAGITDLFFRPYNEKLWQTPLAGMDHGWLAAKIRMPDAGELADSVLGPGGKDSRGEVAPHAEFMYPREGGIESLIEGLVSGIGARRVICGAEVLRIDAGRRTVYTSRGQVRYRRLISTLPLDRAAGLAGLKGPARAAAAGLRATSVVCLRYVLGAGALRGMPDYHWIYVPAAELPFYRFTRLDLINPAAAPGRKVLLVECAAGGPCGKGRAAALARSAGASLLRKGIIRRKDIVEMRWGEYFPAYPVHHAGHSRDVPRCLAALTRAGVIQAGRFGEWAFYNMDHSILAGFRAAGEALR